MNSQDSEDADMDESVPLQPLQYDTMFGALQLAQQANRTTVNEEDRAANAPEVVVSGFPEVLPEDGLEVYKVYDIKSPEDEGKILVELRDFVRSSRFHLSRKGICLILSSIIMMFTIFLALVFGARLFRPSVPPRFIPYGPPSNMGTTSRLLLNDTSFAVARTSSGNRHLFFQADDGTIKQAIYDYSASTWRVDRKFVVANDARNHTPIVAITRELVSTEVITLFYAQTSGRINVLDFRPNSGWEDGSDLGKFLGVDPILDEDSRSLSVTILPQNWTTYPEGLDVLLFYCGAQSKPKGRLTILRSAREQMLWMKTQWHDISETVGETYSSIVAPFTSGMNSDKAINSETPEAYMGFVRQDGPNQIEAIFPYNNESFYMESMNGVGRQFDYKIPVNHSYDVVTPGEKILLWHNGQKLERRPSGWSTPISPFPFRRLAVTKLDSTEGIYYLYHQINGTIFAEDRYDIATDVWYSTNITLT